MSATDTSAPPEATATSGPALRRLEELPGPRGWPVLGNLPQIRPPEFHLQMERWARQYGNYFQLRMGRFRLLVTADHQAVVAVLRDRPDGFRRLARMEQIGLEMGVKGGLFSANGETWKRQRRMVMAAFDPGHVKRYFPTLVVCAERLRCRWQRAAQGGSGIDLQGDLMRFTVDAIAGLAFGTDVNTLESDQDVIQNHLDKIFPKLYARMVTPVPYWRYFKTQSDRELERALATVDAAIDGFVQAARQRLADDPARGAAPHNLLEAMLVAADEPGSGIDDDQVSGNVLTMLLAGEDTTANTLAWCIWLLQQHPAALTRARAEVRSVMAQGGPVTSERLARLNFVEACMHETMRLKPVAPQLPMQAVRDTVVGDVTVPAGSVVMSLLRFVCVDDSLMPDARLFRPERWLGEDGLSAASAKRLSMPFGAGPRICPGRYLALQEMKIVLLTLLQHFDILSVATASGGAPAERLQFAMEPVGLRMRLAPRSVPPENFG